MQVVIDCEITSLVPIICWTDVEKYGGFDFNQFSILSLKWVEWLWFVKTSIESSHSMHNEWVVTLSEFTDEKRSFDSLLHVIRFHSFPLFSNINVDVCVERLRISWHCQFSFERIAIIHKPTTRMSTSVSLFKIATESCGSMFSQNMNRVYLCVAFFFRFSFYSFNAS